MRVNRFISIPVDLSLYVLLCMMLWGGVAHHSRADNYPFGRVFTTPEQREALDKNRDSLISGEHDADADSLELQMVEAQEEEFVLSGLLIRGDGKTQVWVNGESELSDKKKSHGRFGIRERPLADRSVRIKYQDKYRTMKPGQVWIVDEGVVKELHERQPKPQSSSLMQSGSSPTQSPTQKSKNPQPESKPTDTPAGIPQPAPVQEAINIMNTYRAQQPKGG
ncbi:hypothetical protein TDB9533_03959 [Thalassocella blandensis]|nr:hypothetical protein TDB9533_03959 [Thalassocella blandensis]